MIEDLDFGGGSEVVVIRRFYSLRLIGMAIDWSGVYVL